MQFHNRQTALRTHSICWITVCMCFVLSRFYPLTFYSFKKRLKLYRKQCEMHRSTLVAIQFYHFYFISFCGFFFLVIFFLIWNQFSVSNQKKNNIQFTITILHQKKNKNVKKNEQNLSVNWFVYVYISVCHHYHNCKKSLNKQFGQSLKSIGTIFGKCQFEMHHINSEIKFRTIMFNVR